MRHEIGVMGESHHFYSLVTQCKKNLNTSVARLDEHRTDDQEIAGSIPTGSGNICL